MSLLESDHDQVSVCVCEGWSVYTYILHCREYSGAWQKLSLYDAKLESLNQHLRCDVMMRYTTDQYEYILYIHGHICVYMHKYI